MNKTQKLLIGITLTIIIVISGGLVSWFIFFGEQPPEEVPPLFDLFSPNTYSLNSSIDAFGYAVQFNASQIIIEDSLIIANGTINGYNVINSTVLENSTISNDIILISIALYGDQNLTMRNIWDVRLCVVLCEDSSLSLFNCSIKELAIAGSNDVFLSNSSIVVLSSDDNLTSSTALRITNHSYLEYCIISRPTFLEIEYSSIKLLYIIFASIMYLQQTDYIVSGSIKNCSIYNFVAYGQTDLRIYGTDFYQISTYGNSRLILVECITTNAYLSQYAISILNNTKILSELQYGIIVSSDSVNITNDIFEGTNYMNNTIFINASVSNKILKTIVANNTGQVYISNFSCNFFLYDSAKVIINESSTTTSAEYGGYLDGSSKLIGINSSFDFVLCQGNSSVDLSEGCMIVSIYINSTNDVSIDNCILEDVAWHSEPQWGRRAEIINSTVENFIAPPSSKVDIKNCSIDVLYEGIRFLTGINYLNTSGIYGTGLVLDYLNISGSLISNRTYRYIEIMGDANVIIEDLHETLNIVIKSGNLTANNCTISSIQMSNNAIAHLENCSTSGNTFMLMLLSLLGQGITCSDNSHLYINNSTFSEELMMLFNSAEATITNSEIKGIFLLQQSRATISYSEVLMIRVTASTSIGYALNLLHSSVEYLITASWKIQNLAIGTLLIAI